PRPGWPRLLAGWAPAVGPRRYPRSVSLRPAGGLLNLGHDSAFVEELRVHGIPTTEVANGEQLGRHRERVRGVVGTSHLADRRIRNNRSEALRHKLLLA